MINGLSLFTGIGGIDVALSEWVRPIAYCEIDPYCQGIILSRMAGKLLSTAPIWGDVRNFPFKDFTTGLDIIYGGFPCQGISVAGHGKGLADERSGLFWEIVRLSKEIKPKFIFLENVPAITSRGGLTVVRAIAEMGYDCRWCIISAASIGALHRRERWFLLAHAKHIGSHGSEKPRSTEESISNPQEGQNLSKQSERVHITGNVAPESPNGCQYVADTEGEKCSRLSSRETQRQPTTRICGQYTSIDEWQEAVSTICRVTDGVSCRVDRIRALGNAVVPSQAKEAFKILMGIN